MRGDDRQSGSLFSYVDLEARVAADHPLRPIRTIVNDALSGLSGEFEALYSHLGRPSIPPERLLRALLLQGFYSIRSERLLMEQLDYNLLFRWFVGLGIDDPVGHPTAFTTNRDRLLEGDVAAKVLAAVLNHPRVRQLLSREHFTVDGTLVEAELTRAAGFAERRAAVELVAARAGPGPITVGADRAYDAADFVAELRELGAAPHVAPNTAGRRSAIDRRTTRHAGYRLSQRARHRIEEVFAWVKTIAGQSKTKYRGLERVRWHFTLASAAYNLIRLPKLLAAAP
jgi:transposase